MGGEGNRFMMSSLDINNLSISNKFSLPSACYALGLLVIVVTMGIFYHSHRVSSELIIDLTEQKNILSKFRASVAGIDQDLVRLVYLYHQDREESILANVENLAPMLVEFKELADKHDFINDRSLAEEIEPSIEELRRISLEIVGLNLDTMIAPARDLYKYSFLVRAGQVLNFADESLYGKSDQVLAIGLQTKQQQIIFFSSFIVEFIIIFIMIYILHHNIAKKLIDPVQQLQLATHTIVGHYSKENTPQKNEDYFQQATAILEGNSTRDEIGILTTNFKAMIATIEQATHDNISANRQLAKANAELINTQGQLIQSAKLASIGEISAGLAHELNQPLGAIMLSAQFAAELMNDEVIDRESISKKLQRIVGQVERASRIIQHLKIFSRKGEHKFEGTDINWVIDESFILLNETLKMNGIKLIMELAGNLPPVACDFIQIEQVLTNLVTNARDALEQGQAKEIVVRSYAQQNAICIDVHDNGCGMSPAVMAKIFDPFFTTKAVGKGTGLGMSISYGILKDHGGELRVNSTEGQGSCFTISLPLSIEKHQHTNI